MQAAESRPNRDEIMSAAPALTTSSADVKLEDSVGDDIGPEATLAATQAKTTRSKTPSMVDPSGSEHRG